MDRTALHVTKPMMSAMAMPRPRKGIRTVDLPTNSK
jgi:hypothetical protein